MRVKVETSGIKDIIRKHLVDNFDLDEDLAEYISEDIEEILIKKEDD